MTPEIKVVVITSQLYEDYEIMLLFCYDNNLSLVSHKSEGIWGDIANFTTWAAQATFVFSDPDDATLFALKFL